ncbi:MAG: glutamate synthase subunit alpha, partial [Nocardioidaceae bacterium]|nr:glutamate synthase subunit alpha [Nocardioidaceae bacterium]
MRAVPPPQGLYDGRHEHDACGVAFVATLTGIASHDIVEKALIALRNLDHRGASGAEPDSGDGAGIVVQVPDSFLRQVCDFELPPVGGYAVGTAFLPGNADEVAATKERITAIALDEGLRVVGWRPVPTAPDLLGRTARDCMPSFEQLVVAAGSSRVLGMALERMAFCLRKRAEHDTDAYFPSLSSRTLCYKGMLTTSQLGAFFPDLTDERVETTLAVVHSRFSTNTFPSWPLAHPYRFIAHNGEINTVEGNRNWMRAREALLRSDLFGAANSGGRLDRLFPIC